MRQGALKEGRLGKFGLPYNLIIGKECWFFGRLTQFIMILEAKGVPDASTIEYTGMSNVFDKITADEEIPWYKIELDNSVEHRVRSVVRVGGEQLSKQKSKDVLSTKEEGILKKLLK